MIQTTRRLLLNLLIPAGMMIPACDNTDSVESRTPRSAGQSFGENPSGVNGTQTSADGSAANSSVVNEQNTTGDPFANLNLKVFSTESAFKIFASAADKTTLNGKEVYRCPPHHAAFLSEDPGPAVCFPLPSMDILTTSGAFFVEKVFSEAAVCPGNSLWVGFPVGQDDLICQPLTDKYVIDRTTGSESCYLGSGTRGAGSAPDCDASVETAFLDYKQTLVDLGLGSDGCSVKPFGGVFVGRSACGQKACETCSVWITGVIKDKSGNTVPMYKPVR